MAAQWWRDVRYALDLERTVTVGQRGGATRVTVEDVIPHLNLRGRPPRYRITTSRMFLAPTAFPSIALRKAIYHDADKDRHRALFCYDLATEETLAALSFHIDDSSGAPLLLQDLAVRQDGVVENARSAFGLTMLLGYLDKVAELTERPRSLGLFARNPDEAALALRLGMRLCPRPSALTGVGDYWCFEPPARALSGPQPDSR